jgi:hypothetical protein
VGVIARDFVYRSRCQHFRRFSQLRTFFSLLSYFSLFSILISCSRTEGPTDHVHKQRVRWRHGRQPGSPRA